MSFEEKILWWPQHTSSYKFSTLYCCCFHYSLSSPIKISRNWNCIHWPAFWYNHLLYDSFEIVILYFQLKQKYFKRVILEPCPSKKIFPFAFCLEFFLISKQVNIEIFQKTVISFLITLFCRMIYIFSLCLFWRPKEMKCIFFKWNIATRNLKGS